MLELKFFRLPHPVLRPFVEYLFIAAENGGCQSPDGFSYKDLPNGNSKIIFQLGPFPEPGPRPAWNASTVHLWVQGPRSSLREIPANGIEVVGAVVKPGGLRILAGIPASLLVDQLLPLEQIWGHPAEELVERMVMAPDARGRLELMEGYLRHRVAAGTGIDAFVLEAARWIGQKGGKEPLSSFIPQSGYSHRQVIRKFDDWLGFSPKRFARIVRCQRLLGGIHLNQEQDWARLAAQFGYSDQAHLVNDFRKLVGLSPGRFIEDFRRNGVLMPGQINQEILVYSRTPKRIPK